MYQPRKPVYQQNKQLNNSVYQKLRQIYKNQQLDYQQTKPVYHQRKPIYKQHKPSYNQRKEIYQRQKPQAYQMPNQVSKTHDLPYSKPKQVITPPRLAYKNEVSASNPQYGHVSFPGVKDYQNNQPSIQTSKRKKPEASKYPTFSPEEDFSDYDDNKDKKPEASKYLNFPPEEDFTDYDNKDKKPETSKHLTFPPVDGFSDDSSKDYTRDATPIDGSIEKQQLNTPNPPNQYSTNFVENVLASKIPEPKPVLSITNSELGGYKTQDSYQFKSSPR